MTTITFPQTWDLASLAPIPTSDEFRAQFNQFKQRLKSLAEQMEQAPPIGDQPACIQRWTELIQEYEQADAQANDLASLIACYAAADAESKFYRQLLAEHSATAPFREQIASCVEFALRDARPEAIEAFLNGSDVLNRNRYFFKVRKRNSQLRMAKPQELLAADLATDGLHGWGRLFDRISSVLKVPVVEKGKLVERSPGQVKFDSAERTIRENNYLALDKAWGTIADTCADAINHIAGTRLTVYKHLGLKDHLEAPLYANRMTRQTLETMWSTITEHKSVLKDYLSAKAKLLGVDRLAWYDQAAPIPTLPGVANSDDISYDQACSWIIEAFEGFSPDLGQFAEMALKEKWVEAENRSGKQQGGFCTTLPTARQSRIFMTYTNSADSMSTLAHELGHAYHSWVLRDQPLFLQDYPMNLAETASTFAEAVLGEQRLQRAKTDYERLQLLDGMLSDAVAFLMNIHARFLFEDEFHRQRRQGELTAAQLNQLMENAQREAYLGVFSDDGWNPQFWVSKLHFYITSLPFYNFPYTFGYLLSMGVYAIGKDAGKDFPEQYRKLLIATGSQDAEDAVLSTMGFDLRKPDFWMKCLSIVSERVKQFVSLADAAMTQVQKL